MSKYVWVTPRFQSLADAQEVGEALEALEKRDGALAPPAIVTEARKPSSALHPCFKWDVNKAAQKHWETEARALVRSCRIEVRIKGQGKRTRRKWINVSMKGGETQRGYVSISRIKDADHAEAIMEEAARGLRQWASRYNELRARLPGLFDAIDEVLEEQP